MNRNTSKILFPYTDSAVNEVLQRARVGPVPAAGKRSVRYNQSEDQFVLLSRPYAVPSFPVHHDIDDRSPPPGYVDAVADLASFLVAEMPSFVVGTTWFFDPISVLTPSFYRVISLDGELYLYLLRIDLACRPLECEITAAGTNSRTPAYRSDRLFFESDYIPLHAVETESGAVTAACVRQTIPATWKGEAGQGYMIHGIWMDADINKFFSKAFLPEGKRNHPYYPFTCKLHAVCMNAYGFSGPELLHRARRHLEPELDAILDDLQANAFSERLTLFQAFRSRIPSDIGAAWDRLSVSAYLTEREQKEYLVEF